MSFRFYITPEKINRKEKTAILDGAEYKHASTVLRFDVGDELEFIDGEGSLYKGRIVLRKNRAFKLKTLDVKLMFKDYGLSVYVALPKGQKIEFIVKALTELGATKIGIFIGKYSVAKKISNKKVDRLIKIAVEASKQSKRAYFPKIKIIGSFTQLLTEINENKKTIVFHEKATDYLLPENLGTKEIALIIGPEGGLAEEEISCLKKKKAKLSRLSDGILRVETAAIAATQIVRYGQLTNAFAKLK